MLAFSFFCKHRDCGGSREEGGGGSRAGEASYNYI